MVIKCRGFRNSLTGRYQVAVGHTKTREVKPQDVHQVKRCVQCQRAYEWYRWQHNFKVSGQPYQQQFDGPVIQPKQEVK